MKLVNEIVHDERTYIESVGKLDNKTVREALQDEGENTVLRICIGASTETMPLRVLGYAASALKVQEIYFPKAQLQFVYPLHAAEAANDIPINETLPETDKFDFDRCNIGGELAVGGKTGLIDEPFVKTNLVTDVAKVLERDPDIARPLELAASSRQENSAVYLAAHLIMHDTNAELTPLNPLSPQAMRADRIISIGAQSERKFYLARMVCKQAGVIPPDAVAETGQLFTRHVLPPYLQCREGELTLDDYYQRERPAHDFNTAHPVASVSRDLQFFSSYLYDFSPGGYLPAECTLS